MKFQPVGLRVLMRRDQAESMTKSGIVLPGDSRKKVDTAVVVSSGTGGVRADGTIQPCAFAVGDRVIFNQYAVTEVQIEGEMLVLANEADVFGKFTQD
jgi:chaperonin GroES